MGFTTSDARIIDLRSQYPKNSAGMRLRAHYTRVLMRQLLSGNPQAPNLIDGAVLQATISGISAYFEADALAARFGGPIHGGEIKSFPVVDGQVDPEKLAAALDQVALYILLSRLLILDLGGDPDVMSSLAMLITPTNVGLKPTLSTKNVGNRINRIERVLAAVPDVDSIAGSVPGTFNFGTVANQIAEPSRRIDALHDIADRVGTAYTPTCLSTCGNAFFCRERAFRAGAICLTGPKAVRLLPGVHSLDRAADLSNGAPPAAGEAPVAAQLSQAGRLYDAAVRRPHPASGSGDVAV
jgi:hypothetical protein